MSATARRAVSIAERHLADLGLDTLALVDTRSRAARKVRKAQLGRIAVKLRLAGVTYPVIAAVCRVSVGTARGYVVEALQEAETDTLGEASHLRALELSRLDAWEASLQDKLEKGSPEAVNTLLAVQARRLALQGAGIGRSGVMQSPMTDGGANPTGTEALGYVELRAGLLGSPEALARARSLIGEAMQAGAVSGLHPATLEPVAAPQALEASSPAQAPLQGVPAGDVDGRA